MANTGKPSLVVRPNDSRTTITMLETKNVTIQAVGRASSQPHSDVRCADRRGRSTLSTVATQLALTSVHIAARRWTSSAPRRRKTFSFSRSEISTLQAGTSLVRSANAGSASFTGNG